MKKRSILLHYFASAVLAVGAFYAGLASKTANEVRNERTGPLQSRASVISAIPTRAAARAMPESEPILILADGTINSAALVQPLSLTESERCLRRGLESIDPIERELLISQAVSQLTRRNAPALLAVLESMDWNDRGSLRDSVFERFMLAWGRADGPSALAYPKTLGTKHWSAHGMMTRFAIRGWAESDPESAIPYLSDALLSDDGAGVLPSSFPLQAVHTVGRSLENNQKALLALVDQIFDDAGADSSRARLVLCDALASRTTDPRAVAAWLDRNRGYPYDSYDVNFVVEKWAKTDPVAALEWVNQSSDSRVRENLDAVLRVWSETDPAAVAAWTRANMDDPRTHHLRQYGLRGTDSLPAKIEWVASLDPQTLTTGLASELAERWIPQAPADALRWIESLPNKSMQSWSLYQAAKSCPRDRVGDYATALMGAGREERYDKARQELSARLVGMDPVMALQVAFAIADDVRRQRATALTAKRLIRENPGIIKSWLPNSGLPEKEQLEIRLSDPNL